MTHPALRMALRARRSGASSRDARVFYATELAAFGIFSKRNIAAITGLSVTTVSSVVAKRAPTGGRLNPDSLADIKRLAKAWEADSRDRGLARKVLANGTSVGMLSRLTGISTSTLERWRRGQ